MRNRKRSNNVKHKLKNKSKSKKSKKTKKKQNKTKNINTTEHSNDIFSRVTKSTNPLGQKSANLL